MYPPIYPAIAASTSCVALLKSGNGPIRFFQFGFSESPAPQLPYGVWQRVFGTPDNYLGDVPDIDSYTLLVDVFASSASSARTVAEAIRDAIEPVAHITSWLGESIDPDTRNYRFSFNVDFWTPR